MKTSKLGYDLIKEFEGYHRALPNGDAAAYLDPVGIWTIGFGSIRLNGRAVRSSDVISRKLAQELLEEEVAGFEKDVVALVKVTLNENQFSALVSLFYNIGAGAFASSTARRLLNAGNYSGCADAMLMFNKGTIGGRLVELSGLTRRRKAEREMFLRGVDSVPTPVPISSGRPYAPCPVPLPWTLTMRKGDKAVEVYQLQCALIGLGFLAKPGPGERVGDVFNEHVKYAVTQFQRDQGLPVDGRVGSTTRDHIARLLVAARALKTTTPANGDALLTNDKNSWHDGAWAGLRRLSLQIGDDTFAVASGARGAQTFRRPQDPRSVPGNLEPIPQGRYSIGAIEFAGGRDNYEGSFGAGLGPVWVGLSAGFSDDRGAFGFHLDSNMGSAPGSAGCVVLRDTRDLKRFVAALREHNPKHLWVEWGL